MLGGSNVLAAVFRYIASLVTTEIGCVTWWISKERLGQKEVLDRDETAMVFNVETTTTTTTTKGPRSLVFQQFKNEPHSVAG